MMGRWLDQVYEGKRESYGLAGDKTAKTPAKVENRSQSNKSPNSVVPNFCRLVRSFGISHGIILHDKLILAELDAGDIKDLKSITKQEKQQWAELLAYRLANESKPPRL